MLKKNGNMETEENMFHYNQMLLRSGTPCFQAETVTKP